MVFDHRLPEEFGDGVVALVGCQLVAPRAADDLGICVFACLPGRESCRAASGSSMALWWNFLESSRYRKSPVMPYRLCEHLIHPPVFAGKHALDVA